MKASLEKRFAKRLVSLDAVSPGDRILVAFSGGKDSAALLSLLDRVKDRFGFSLRACHVNHGIRGEEADRDEAFCQAFCKERSIPLSVCRADVPAFCRRYGVGTEEGARTERYRLLRETAKRSGCRWIATAHTADDQAETVLFRLARGAGLTGAAGIPAIAGDLIRPLLPFSGREIASYLKTNGLPFITDSTNEDLSYARNRIRKEVLPALEKAVPGCADALVRFAQTAARQNAMIRKCADDWEQNTGNDPDSGALSLRDAAELAKEEVSCPLLYEILHRMMKKSGMTLTNERFLAVVSLLKSDFSGKLIEIADGFGFFADREQLRFGKAPAVETARSFQRVLKVGDNPLPEIGAVLSLSEPAPGKVRNIHKNLLIIHAASDTIEGALFARDLHPGDRIRLNGMSKSVKKALCDAGLSAEERKTIPAICDESGIFWVPRLGLCDRARDPRANGIFTMDLKYNENSKWDGCSDES